MRVDARELRALGEANAAGELEDAESLYRGPFLSDLALEGEAFYAWASAERARLDADAGTVLSMLVGRAVDAGDAGRATALVARLVVIDPFREDWLRLSLRVTARHLGRDKALLQARDFVDLLKRARRRAGAGNRRLDRTSESRRRHRGRLQRRCVRRAERQRRAGTFFAGSNSGMAGIAGGRAGRPPSGDDIGDRCGGSGAFDRRPRRVVPIRSLGWVAQARHVAQRFDR